MRILGPRTLDRRKGSRTGWQMTNSPELSAPGLRPLRILEIGAHEVFVSAVGKQTEFYWTGIKPRGLAHRALGPIRIIRSLMKLRRREFDLLVVHATDYPPWHPRSILTTLRDWNIQAPLVRGAKVVAV